MTSNPIAALIVLGIALTLLIIPFLIPVPSLQGTFPPHQLADPDSRFIRVNGLDVHYKLTGQGELVIVLLHGFVASVFTWREVTQPLSERGTVIAFDRPAFGLTERPMRDQWQGTNPYTYEAQVALTIALMDALGIQHATLIGHSAGGRIALLIALQHPDRIDALILVDPAIYHDPHDRGWVNWLLGTPQMRRIGPMIMRSIQHHMAGRFAARSWRDPSRITEAIWAGYRLPLQALDWDRALWEYTIASRPTKIVEHLNTLKLPVLVISGDDDRVVPAEDSRRAANAIPGAQFVLLSECGHVPHEECPDAFLTALLPFLNQLAQTSQH